MPISVSRSVPIVLHLVSGYLICLDYNLVKAGLGGLGGGLEKVFRSCPGERDRFLAFHLVDLGICHPDFWRSNTLLFPPALVGSLRVRLFLVSLPIPSRLPPWLNLLSLFFCFCQTFLQFYPVCSFVFLDFVVKDSGSLVSNMMFRMPYGRCFG